MKSERISLLALVGCLVLGCGERGDDEPAQRDAAADAGGVDAEAGRLLPGFASGSRLIARSIGSPGSAARKLVAFHDRELAVDCAFGYASDGSLRCIPTEALSERSDLVFADEACSEPAYALGARQGCAGDPLWASEAVVLQTLCKVHATAIYTLRELQQSFTARDGCAGPEPAEHTFARGVEVAPSTMVAAGVTYRDAGSGLRALMLETLDGARVVLDIDDPRYGACSAVELRQSGLRCVPDDAARTSVPAGVEQWLWADATCEDEPLAYRVSVATDEPVCPSKPPFAVVSERGEALPQLVELGAIFNAVRHGGVACDEIAASPEYPAYRLGEPAHDDAVAPLQWIAYGDGEVQVRYPATERGVLIPISSGTLFDVAREAACEAWPTASGDYRCLPESLGWANSANARYFADAACEEELIQSYGEVHGPQLIALTTIDECPAAGAERAIEELRELIAVVPDEVYRDDGTSCAIALDDAEVRYYRLGDDVLDDYPRLTVEDDSPSP